MALGDEQPDVGASVGDFTLRFCDPVADLAQRRRLRGFPSFDLDDDAGGQQDVADVLAAMQGSTVLGRRFQGRRVSTGRRPSSRGSLVALVDQQLQGVLQ